MQLVRFATESRHGWGFLEGDTVVEAPSRDPIELGDAIAGGLDQLRRLRNSACAGRKLPDVRLLRPLERPSKIIGVARNYRGHGSAEHSEQPLLFGILPSALIGPGETIRLPRGAADRVDWEVELGVVIGSGGRHISEENALEHVIGYTIVNDVSSREMVVPADKLFRCKSYDTFKPTGPAIVTVDELGPASDLRLTLEVNAIRKQDASTSDLIHSVAALVAFCSAVFTLSPGDLIATGTPAGVGASSNPPEFLTAGDEVVCRIDQIGELRNPVGREFESSSAAQHARAE